MSFTDYRTTSNESMLAKHSNLLPIQPSRASSLLPSQTRWVTPTISTAVIDFLPINQARLRFCPFQGILRTLWKVAMPFIREKFSSTFFSMTMYNRKIKQNSFFKPTPLSPYMRLAVSPEMDRTCSLAWFIGKKSITAVDIVGVTHRVCEGRRLDALDGWIGNRLECLASILSLLVVL